MKRIAIIGTQGIPAHYGGFESLAENLVRYRDARYVEYTVFCSSRDLPTRDTRYCGAELKYLPLHSNGVQSILYDIASMIMCIRGYDILLVLGVSGCIFIPVLKMLTRSRIMVNIDGMEYRRRKWGRTAGWFLRISEKTAVKYADTVIADNAGIREYVHETYGKDAVLIAYGGDHALMEVPVDRQALILSGFGLEKGRYALSVCRIEPENNVDMVLDAVSHTGDEMVIVGNFRHDDYSMNLKKRYGTFRNIHLLDACYDIEVLYILRRNAAYYIHGHSAGGTNPSLVEMMHFGVPIIAYDVNFNRFTTGGEAEYFTCTEDLESLIRQPRRASGPALEEYAHKNYKWEIISRKYEYLFV